MVGKCNSDLKKKVVPHMCSFIFTLKTPTKIIMEAEWYRNNPHLVHAIFGLHYGTLLAIPWDALDTVAEFAVRSLCVRCDEGVAVSVLCDTGTVMDY